MATLTLKKISELIAASDYGGLWTIGVDSKNRSVKISLSWMKNTKEEIEQATKDAISATSSANNAASQASKDAEAARQAASLANQKASEAGTAASAANSAAAEVQKRLDTADADHRKAVEDHSAAATDHELAIADHDTAKSDHDKAASDHSTAQSDHEKASADHVTASSDHSTAEMDHAEAVTATDAANEAAENARKAAEQLGYVMPFGMEVSYPARVTLGNLYPLYIDATITPEHAGKNVLYLSDGVAVLTEPDGRIVPVAPGISRIHVIPTLNTALYKTIQIKVTRPEMRLVNGRANIRLTGSGALRLT